MADTMKDDTQNLKERLKQAEAIQVKTAAYIETVQPQVDAYNELKDRFTKRAHEVAGILADRGIIAPSATNKLVDKLAADQTKALDLIVQIADMIKVSDFGKQADVSVPQADPSDPFGNLIRFGDSRANANTGHGNVD